MLSQHLCYTARLSAPSSATSVADPDPGSGAFLTPGSEIGFFWDPGSQIVFLRAY